MPPLPQTAGLPNSENTLMEIRLAFLAMPEKVCTGVALAPLPAAMPATCVPCRQDETAQGAAAPATLVTSSRPPGQVETEPPFAEDVVEKQASYTTLLAPPGLCRRNTWPESTPVSMIAMFWPTPV